MFTYKYDKLYEDIESRRGVTDACCQKKMDESKNIVALKHITQKQIKIDSHFHDWLEFSLVLKGEQEVTIGDQTYRVGKGDFYMVDYNVIHGNETHDEEAAKATLQIRRSYLKKIAPMFSSQNIYCRSMSITTAEEYYHYEKLVEIYAFMFDLFYKDDEVSRMGFDGMLKVFLYMLIEYFTLSDEEIRQRTAKENRHIQDILAYMHNHYHEELTLNRLSEELYLSPKYISKLIKNELGINFKEYLVHIRINHAVYEMLNSDMSLLDICYGCGFASQKSFIEFFKKEYGQTPNKFRAEQKERAAM